MKGHLIQNKNVGKLLVLFDYFWKAFIIELGGGYSIIRLLDRLSQLLGT